MLKGRSSGQYTTNHIIVPAERIKCGGIRYFNLWLSKKFILRVSYGILGFGVHVPRPYPLTTSPPPHSPSPTATTRDHLNLPDTLSSPINPLREPKSTSSLLLLRPLSDTVRILYYSGNARNCSFVRAQDCAPSPSLTSYFFPRKSRRANHDLHHLQRQAVRSAEPGRHLHGGRDGVQVHLPGELKLHVFRSCCRFEFQESGAVCREKHEFSGRLSFFRTHTVVSILLAVREQNTSTAPTRWSLPIDPRFCLFPVPPHRCRKGRISDGQRLHCSMSYPFSYYCCFFQNHASRYYTTRRSVLILLYCCLLL